MLCCIHEDDASNGLSDKLDFDFDPSHDDRRQARLRKLMVIAALQLQLNSTGKAVVQGVVAWRCCCTLMYEDGTYTYVCGLSGGKDLGRWFGARWLGGAAAHSCTKMIHVCVMAYGTTLTLMQGVIPAAVHTCVSLRIPSLYCDATVHFFYDRRTSPPGGARLGFPPPTSSLEGSAHAPRARGSLCSLPQGERTAQASGVSTSRDIFLADVSFFCTGFQRGQTFRMAFSQRPRLVVNRFCTLCCCSCAQIYHILTQIKSNSCDIEDFV